MKREVIKMSKKGILTRVTPSDKIPYITGWFDWDAKLYYAKKALSKLKSKD